MINGVEYLGIVHEAGIQWEYPWIWEIYSYLEPKLRGYFGIFRIAFSLCYLVCLMNEYTDPTRESQSHSPLSPVLTTTSLSLFITSLSIFWGISWMPFNLYLYPLSLGILLITAWPVALHFIPINEEEKIRPVGSRKKIRGKYSLSFPIQTTQGKRYVNITNPFRGIAIGGSPGGGKTASWAVGILDQWISREMGSILLYDFKFDDLTRAVYHYAQQSGKGNLRLISPVDLTRSHRVNPLHPEMIPTLSHAGEYAATIYLNLGATPSQASNMDYWSISGRSLLQATIWYLRTHHPRLSSFPHLLRTICHPRVESFIQLLARDAHCGPLVADLATALQAEAGKQAAGVIGTLQASLARLNLPEVFWTLSGETFSLTELEQPNTFLCVGTSDTLAETYAPCCALIISAALKVMLSHKQPGLILLDEAPTLNLPNLWRIPETARSKKKALVYIFQDQSQLIDQLTRNKADRILANLSNQMYGRIIHPESQKHISRMFGTREIQRKSHGYNRKLGAEDLNRSVSSQRQYMEVVQPYHLRELERGEFIGFTVEPHQDFRGKVKLNPAQRTFEPIPPFATGMDIEQHFHRIHQEVEDLYQSMML